VLQLLQTVVPHVLVVPNYGDDEYVLFQQRSPHMSLSEQEFRQALHQINERWVDLGPLQTTIHVLLEALTVTRLEETWWYDPEWTLQDLQALAHTLALAARRYATQVRIQFT
jgi:hypothetical protein